MNNLDRPPTQPDEPNREKETSEDKYKNLIENFREATREIRDLGIIEKLKAKEKLTSKEQLAWINWKNLHATKKMLEGQKEDVESMVETVEKAKENLVSEESEKNQEKEISPAEQKYQELEKDYEQVKILKDKNLDEYIDELENLLVKWNEVLEEEKDMPEEIKKKYENLRKSIGEDLDTAYEGREEKEGKEAWEKSERGEDLSEEEVIAKEKYFQKAEKEVIGNDRD